jgi:hypothetical protein
MKVQPITAIEKFRSTQNDLFDRCGGNVRCTIQADKAANTPDAESLTHDRAIAFARDCDSSFKVDLNSKDIPLFLYNQNGKLT